jgi:tight adherence protein B
MNLPAITFVLALTLSLTILLLATRPPGPSKSARQRLTSIRHSVNAQKSGARDIDLEQDANPGLPARLTQLLARYQFSNKLKLLITHANSAATVGSTVLASIGSALAGGIAALFYFRALPVAAAAAIVASSIPYLLLRRKRTQRLKAFNNALPGAIELMARALRAGHAIGTAIELIADQSPQPLGGEFAQVYQQQRVGLQFRDALLQMGTRVPSRDLQFLITAILVQKETGGDLTEILDRATHVIRERIRIEGEVRTHSAQGRLTGWILGLLPVVMLALINIVSPGYSTVLFHDPTGQKLLAGGSVLILIGGLVIRKIVDVQV